jgi:hypothetical protein
MYDACDAALRMLLALGKKNPALTRYIGKKIAPSFCLLYTDDEKHTDAKKRNEKTGKGTNEIKRKL